MDSLSATIRPNRPYLPRRSAAGRETAGDGNDFAAEASEIITQSVGTFPTVTGVTKETDDGSSNDYSIQLNSNFMTKARCHTISGCQAWEQFVYSSSSKSAFMQYWLIGQGTSPSGAGWIATGNDCYKNSAAVSVPRLAISGLSTMKMSGAAVKGGNDTLVFTADGEAYRTNGKDSVVELALDWTASEFNIIGDGGGSEAIFNAGSSLTVKIAVTGRLHRGAGLRRQGRHDRRDEQPDARHLQGHGGRDAVHRVHRDEVGGARAPAPDVQRPKTAKARSPGWESGPSFAGGAACRRLRYSVNVAVTA